MSPLDALAADVRRLLPEHPRVLEAARRINAYTDESRDDLASLLQPLRWALDGLCSEPEIRGGLKPAYNSVRSNQRRAICGWHLLDLLPELAMQLPELLPVLQAAWRCRHVHAAGGHLAYIRRWHTRTGGVDAVLQWRVDRLHELGLSAMEYDEKTG